ncbi:CPBP family intramembrane glutamic endopeptidase [Homoserinimonas sp. OAct 916]|uniref:CPBP family intramembrane glutamic endopeptidase n=1 Tax=Homoserinimonas sp. OAct 916 TaxID=2211450 RepID=UPI000DBE72FF|nr:CPBP family intramembrane glutamic endopeptidase [Homoserinimonas sp. OAct 916]
MLSPDASFTPWVLGVVLAALLGLIAWRAGSRDRREYERFKRYRSTKRRQAMLRKWVLQSLGWFGGSAIFVLALVWPFVPRMLDEIETWPLMAGFRGLLADNSLALGLLVGGGVGLLLGLVGTAFLGRKAENVMALGDTLALLPRNRAELKYGWALSINAGVVEELLFRLAMPVLIFAVFGNALIAIVVSLILFGLMHAYQGVGGVIGAFVLGVVLMALFLATGSIVWPIILHAVFDLRSLVLIPLVVFKVNRVGPQQGTPDSNDSRGSTSN